MHIFMQFFKSPYKMTNGKGCLLDTHSKLKKRKVSYLNGSVIRVPKK